MAEKMALDNMDLGKEEDRYNREEEDRYDRQK